MTGLPRARPQFFKDGREFDGHALVDHMVRGERAQPRQLDPYPAHLTLRRPTPCTQHALCGQSQPLRGGLVVQVASYRFLDGMEELLQRLYSAGYQLHAMSNYPLW